MLVKTLKTPFKTLTALALATGGASLSHTQAAVVGPGTVHTVKLGWNAVAEPNIQGYKVHVGTQPGQYTRTLDAGTSLSYSVDGLSYGQTYYFSVRTVGLNGQESGYSPELVLSVSLPQLPPSATLSSTGTTGLQWSYPKSALNSYPDFVIETSTDLVNWTPGGTVSSDSPSGGTATHATYTWPIVKNGQQRFYRLSARNWLGDSSAP